MRRRIILQENIIEDEKEITNAKNSLFLNLHGHVLETAKCRYKNYLLENLLIKRGLTNQEELKTLYEESLKEKLPEFFSKTEETIGHQKMKLVFKDNGEIYITDLE